ncbi:Hemolysin, putative [Moritella viscosa]|uniref:PAQR family membrane homeostasis protein TrhA n=1 Tax=Moritella viscosa TaxID=80854 RepID=UPI000508EF97|nr:hemolysin III family protein [Moritella viscosa]CED61129.1 hemolysin III [Moritella viscosa]SHN99783.1 Hemolysin, putative [Moritella viscosa]SHO21098.1 Hemolysin, putative [Moritella viscosa]
MSRSATPIITNIGTVAAPYSAKEEAANTWSHIIGVLLSIAALIALLVPSIQQADPWRITSFSIYGISMFLLFFASSAYHYASNPATKAKLKTLDHCAIFLLIAGTYTPLLLIELRGVLGWSIFGVVWSMALFGIIAKVYWAERFKKVSLFFYLIMGWLIVFSGDELLGKLATGALYWLIAGGVAYSIGAIFYANKRIPYNHAIWHIFVLLGSACHFITIYLYILPVSH